MAKSSFWLDSEDDVKLHVQKWIKPRSNDPKAIVQISHGMVEHIGRYDDFAHFLVSQNIFVYGNDHRGHGQTGTAHGMMGLLSEKDGFEKATNDLYIVTKHIQEEHPETPIFLLGHSFGSFLARHYIQLHSEDIEGVIISGTGGHPGMANIAAKRIAQQQLKKDLLGVPSPMLNKLVFRAYNKRVTNPKSPFDWLSHDEKQVLQYAEDPLCGFIPSASFFYDMFHGLDLVHNDKLIKKIRKGLPMLFVTGEEDPVGKYGSDIWKVMKQYQKHDIDDITANFYPHGRHEMLNEINKVDVYKDILKWIEFYLPEEDE
ncbi:alpha/beta hydrolase [Radiobacillus kanasensis]|uniref:alpha/beta hydrolase n=1 Tax=Radiobacillus kanasensis TaxID=2844358 RepID=UPI001E58ABAE|nr:alpha/beta hydrolase [Radiobacillus kanasensis]UFT98456.1 alpha/beta hydrolase [Radiobacillus kanasensis]